LWLEVAVLVAEVEVVAVVLVDLEPVLDYL
jgi:hypothetical protein